MAARNFPRKTRLSCTKPGQHDHSIFLPLALTNGDRHALRVDVADEQIGRLRPPQARGIDRHQQGAGLQMCRSNEELVFSSLFETALKVANYGS